MSARGRRRAAGQTQNSVSFRNGRRDGRFGAGFEASSKVVRGGGKARGRVLRCQAVTASTRTCPSSSTLCLKGSMRNFPRPLIVRVSWSPAPGETRFGHRRIPRHTPEMHPSGYAWEGSRSRPSMTLELPAPVMKGRSRRLRSRLVLCEAALAPAVVLSLSGRGLFFQSAPGTNRPRVVDPEFANPARSTALRR